MQPHRWLTGLQHDSIDQKFVLNNVKLRPKGPDSEEEVDITGQGEDGWTEQGRKREQGEQGRKRRDFQFSLSFGALCSSLTFSPTLNPDPSPSWCQPHIHIMRTSLQGQVIQCHAQGNFDTWPGGTCH